MYEALPAAARVGSIASSHPTRHPQPNSPSCLRQRLGNGDRLADVDEADQGGLQLAGWRWLLLMHRCIPSLSQCISHRYLAGPELAGRPLLCSAKASRQAPIRRQIEAPSSALQAAPFPLHWRRLTRLSCAPTLYSGTHQPTVNWGMPAGAAQQGGMVDAARTGDPFLLQWQVTAAKHLPPPLKQLAAAASSVLLCPLPEGILPMSVMAFCCLPFTVTSV